MIESKERLKPPQIEEADFLRTYRLFDYIPVGICVIDRFLRIIFWNECLEDWTSMKRSTVFGKDLRECCPRFSTDYYTRRILSVFTDSAPVVFSSQLHKSLFPAVIYNGTPQIQHVKLTILAPEENGDMHAMFSIEDVSELDKRLTEYRNERHRKILEIERRMKVEKQLRALIEEKEFLLREVHHRIKNNLALVAGLIGLKEDLVHDSRDKSILVELKSKIQAISLVHEKLNLGMDIKSINLREYIASLLPILIDSGSDRKIPVEVRHRIDDVCIPVDTAIPVTLLVTELVINALKHAFPENRGGTVEVAFLKDGKGNYILTVSDDGRGLPEDLDIESTESLGLQLVRSFAQQLDAGMEVSSGVGTGFRFLLSEKTIV